MVEIATRVGEFKIISDVGEKKMKNYLFKLKKEDVNFTLNMV